MYDAALGRFIQPDTIVAKPGSTQGMNRYAYVMNNPVNFIDPTGNRESGACGAFGEDCGGTILSDLVDAPQFSIKALSYRTSTNENQISSDESVTIKGKQEQRIGNSETGIDYYSDNLSDPVIQTKNPLALAPAFLDWLSRFRSPQNIQEEDSNFFINYQFTIHEPNEYLTIDSLSVTNYYSDNPVYLRSITIENGKNKYVVMNNDFQLTSGFGSSYNATNLPIELNPYLYTIIEFNVYGIGVMNAGNGPINWPYQFSIIIPGIKE